MSTLCQHFGSCGGCTTQNMPYADQLAKKEKLIAELFPDVLCHPIIPCENPWQYRNKMEFSFAESREGRRIGLYAKKHVFDLQECSLTPQWFHEAVEKARAWWLTTELHAYYPPRDRGFLRTLTFRQGFHTGDKMVILHVAGHEQHSIEGFADLFPDCSVILRIQHSTRGTATYFEEIVLRGNNDLKETLHVLGSTFHFSISPSAFFQPNPKQAEKLYSKALTMAGITKDSIVFDLYCGTGALGMFAARIAKQVIGVELNAEAVNSANANAKANHLDNITFIAGDVGKVLSELTVRPDIVLVDPPRAGLSQEAIEHLKALSPKILLYISCNPKTQKENSDALGFTLKEVQPVDQFPHTDHLENIALFA